MTYASFIFWIVFVLSLFSSPATVLTLVLASLSFGSLSVVPPEVTGGVTILPQAMFSIVLILKGLAGPIVSLSPELFSAARLRNLGFLLLFLAVGIATTILMPRLFFGAAIIVPMRPGQNLATEILQPGQANFTQTAYLTLSVVVVFSTALLAGLPQFPKQLLSALLLGGIVAAATGLIDMAATAIGVADILEPFRNASYAVLSNSDVHGVRRVIGLMPEASSYGALCAYFASSLTFLRPFYPAGVMRFGAGFVALALLGMALLSTSSSTYGGLAVLGAVYLVNCIRRLLQSSGATQAGVVAEFAVLFVILIVLLVVWIVQESVFDPIFEIINEIIFNKTTSTSYFERSYWNTIGWEALRSTYGIGVGLGSTRTSNWFIAVISNAGVLGTALLGIFLALTFFRRLRSGSTCPSEMLTAMKVAIIPWFATAALASTSPDFGPWVALMLGAITGMASPAIAGGAVDSQPRAGTYVTRRARRLARPGSNWHLERSR
jgi:hypothetical protein